MCARRPPGTGAWCDSLSTPSPLGPVRDLAPLLGLSIDERPLDDVAREGLFRDILAALAARPEPTVVIAEDAHWADGATLELFRFLSRRIGGLQTLLLWESGERNISTDGLAEPYRLQIAGDMAAAADARQALGCPYEEASALAAR